MYLINWQLFIKLTTPLQIFYEPYWETLMHFML